MNSDGFATRGLLTRSAIVGGGVAAAPSDRDQVARLGEYFGAGAATAPVRFRLGGDGKTFSFGVEALSQLGLQEALVRRREQGFDLHHTAFTLQLSRAVTTGLMIAAGAPAAAWWFTEPPASDSAAGASRADDPKWAGERRDRRVSSGDER